MAKSLQIQVAERVRFLLTEKGWNQNRLAEASGFHKGYISLVLAAKKNMTLESIETLEKALGSPIVRILGTNKGAEKL